VFVIAVRYEADFIYLIIQALLSSLLHSHNLDVRHRGDTSLTPDGPKPACPSPERCRSR
jgi:hypothetical protein